MKNALLLSLLTLPSLTQPACTDLAADAPTGRQAPAAEVVQRVLQTDPSSDQPQVVTRSFGAGHVMFELDRSIDASQLDVARTRLMTVRVDATGALETIEAAGDSFLDETGRTLVIALADAPRAGEIYRAVTVIDGEVLDLGDVIVREAPAGDARADHALYLPGLAGSPDAGTTTVGLLQLASSAPTDGQINVDRDLLRVTIKYASSQVDCGNPITGISSFHLYSVDPALTAARQQHMYPNMPVGFGPTPTLVCDAARNQISMELPGYLLGGTVFKVDTQARATDGSTLSVTTTFRTKNPGLHVAMTKATNEIYQCDTKIPFSSSYRCDMYLMGMIKTRTSPTQAWQVNSKIPASGDWSNWAEDTSKTFSATSQIALYKDAIAVGDPVAVELHAYDADTGDGYKQALAFVGGLGKVASPFYPPAGVVGEGLTQIANALPVDDDDFEGGGTYFLPKTGRWGTVTRNHTFKLPGRPVDSQVVINFSVYEYPAPWYAPAIVQ